MIKKIILASKSGVRKNILDQNNIPSEVIPANVDEDLIKESLTKSSSTFAGITTQLIPFLFNIIFLTPLFDARIIFLIILYLVYLISL